MGTIGRNGGRCLLSESPMPLDYVRARARAGRIGTRLMSIVAESQGTELPASVRCTRTTRNTQGTEKRSGYGHARSSTRISCAKLWDG